MKADCPYQKALHQQKRRHSRPILETAIIMAIIMATVAFLGHMQIRDEKAKQADLKKELEVKCQSQLSRKMTEFNCAAIQ
jgi:hypothetical protein